MRNSRTIAGVLALGSLWGFAECIIGAWLRDAGLPAGTLMTAIIAIGLLPLSKTIFPQRGTQLGMGLVAGTLRLISPFGGCYICSAVAIMAEGALFELLWTWVSTDHRQLQTLTMQACLGIITGYVVYVGGYTVTQILTPLLSTAGFDPANLLAFTPQYPRQRPPPRRHRRRHRPHRTRRTQTPDHHERLPLLPSHYRYGRCILVSRRGQYPYHPPLVR